MTPPKVLIHVENGIIQEVYSEDPLNLIIVDIDDRADDPIQVQEHDPAVTTEESIDNIIRSTVEKYGLQLLKDGVFDKADELIEEHGLDKAEMYAKAFPGQHNNSN